MRVTKAGVVDVIRLLSSISCAVALPYDAVGKD